MDGETVDHEQIARLFDPSRDPGERVRDDDWFTPADRPDLRELYAEETVAARRRWYLALVADGRVKGRGVSPPTESSALHADAASGSLASTMAYPAVRVPERPLLSRRGAVACRPFQ
jgi:hypothetical protein